MNLGKHGYYTMIMLNHGDHVMRHGRYNVIIAGSHVFPARALSLLRERCLSKQFHRQDFDFHTILNDFLF